MKIKNQKWVVGTVTMPQNEVEIINDKNRSRIARITITDFKSKKQARKIAKAIASVPGLLKKKSVKKRVTMEKLNSKKDVKVRAEMLLEKCILTVRERERAYAKADAISICQTILISLEDLNAHNDLIQYWIGVRKYIEKS